MRYNSLKKFSRFQLLQTMRAIHRITGSNPVHQLQIHRHILRNFSNPKAIPELSRQRTVVQRVEIRETRSEIEHENEEEGDVNVDNIDDSNVSSNHSANMNEDCSLSNPYYYRLLNSKL